jgi:hypothetical protein
MSKNVRTLMLATAIGLVALFSAKLMERAK